MVLYLPSTHAANRIYHLQKLSCTVHSVELIILHVPCYQRWTSNYSISSMSLQINSQVAALTFGTWIWLLVVYTSCSEKKLCHCFGWGFWYEALTEHTHREFEITWYLDFNTMVGINHESSHDLRLIHWGVFVSDSSQHTALFTLLLLLVTVSKPHIWQSWVENEHCSISMKV